MAKIAKKARVHPVDAAVEAAKKKAKEDSWRRLAKETIDGATGLDDIGPTIYVTEIYDKDGEPLDDEEAIDFISDAIQDEIIRRWDAYEVMLHRNASLKLKLKRLRASIRMRDGDG